MKSTYFLLWNLLVILFFLRTNARLGDTTRCPYFHSTNKRTDTNSNSSNSVNPYNSSVVTAGDVVSDDVDVIDTPTSDSNWYDLLLARQKLDYIWSLLLSNRTTADLVPLTEGLLFVEPMPPSVDFVSDFIPLGRRKAVHGNGVVAKVELVIDSPSPFTGLLSTGSKYALWRFSSVLDPSQVGGPVPSFSLKFFRDGKPSVNWVGLNTQIPQSITSNPFFPPITNMFVGAPQNVIDVFSTVSGYPNFTGNSQLAQHNNYYTDWGYGKMGDTKNIFFPWQLIFVPNPRIQRQFPATYHYTTSEEYYRQFIQYNSNRRSKDNLLYTLYAVTNPHGKAFYLGKLFIRTPFYRSEFGDQVLFFKHTVEEDDIKFRPELGKICPSGSIPGCTPCPQTYDCWSSDWKNQIVPNTIGALYYNSDRFIAAEGFSSVVQDVYDSYMDTN